LSKRIHPSSTLRIRQDRHRRRNDFSRRGIRLFGSTRSNLERPRRVMNAGNFKVVLQNCRAHWNVT
jgi:hypothetical protein